MTDLTLEREIRQVLAELELISHGSITAYNSSGGGHGANNLQALPPGEGHPPHLIWRQRFTDAADDTRRRSLLDTAQEELAAFRRRSSLERVSLSEGEILVEQILEAVGWSPEEVSRVRKCSPKKVREIRMQNARHCETGQAIANLSLTEQQAKAVDLAEKGLSQTQIAHRMGISQPRVSQLLKFRRMRVAA